MGPSTDMQQMIDFITEQQKPIYHTPINLGIKDFKRRVRTAFDSRPLQNKLIKAFKKRAWVDYEGIARHRGNFPTHPVYGKKIKVKRSPIFIDDIEVKHG